MISRRALCRRVAAIMIDYGVQGYSVRVGRSARGSWAHCDYSKREIVLSPSLCWTDWVFANQIALHEVAHAIAGPHSQHGRKWANTARAMGYRLGAIVPYRERVVGLHRYVITCVTGEHSAIRFEPPKDGFMCGPCNTNGAGEVPLRFERL